MMPKPSRLLAFGLGLMAALPCAAPAARAQAADRVATHGDWSVFVATSPTKECYVVSPPKSSKATRDGKPTTVDRGDIRLFVTYRPAEKVRGEVSFSAGYPIKAGSPVKLAIGSDSFSLTPGESGNADWAWPTPDADSKIGAALRKGSTATVAGQSARGTNTVDTFSLSGFSAAIKEAEDRCS
ncbi:MAG: invasion associated locus B family protein [Amaricoccus sp.]